MTYFTVTNLDYMAIKMEGMACVMTDNGDNVTAYELKKMAKDLKDMSKELKATQPPKDVQ